MWLGSPWPDLVKIWAQPPCEDNYDNDNDDIDNGGDAFDAEEDDGKDDGGGDDDKAGRAAPELLLQFVPTLYCPPTPTSQHQ